MKEKIIDLTSDLGYKRIINLESVELKKTNDKYIIFYDAYNEETKNIENNKRYEIDFSEEYNIFPLNINLDSEKRKIIIKYDIYDPNSCNKYNLKSGCIYRVKVNESDESVGNIWYMRFIGINEYNEILCKSNISLDTDNDSIDFISSNNSILCNLNEILSIIPCTDIDVKKFEYIEKNYKDSYKFYYDYEKWSELYMD